MAEDVYADVSFPARKERPYVVINMVSSLDGKAAISGKAGSIGSPTDRVLMRTLRARADAVMTGAGTLRAERLTLAVPENLARERKARGLRPQPLAVVATSTGEVPLRKNLIGPSPENVLILASPETPHSRLSELSFQGSVEVVAWKDEKETARSRLDLTTALEMLKARYAVDVLLVEGGPALNHALISDGIADEFFLTLAPRFLGGVHADGSVTVLEGSPLQPKSSPNPKLISVHLSGNELFFRYTLTPAS